MCKGKKGKGDSRERGICNEDDPRILVEWNWFLRVKLSKLDVQTDFCVY